MSKQKYSLLVLLAGCLSGWAQAEPLQALSCYLEPSADVTVGTTAEGRLTRMLVDRSDHVKAGQLLAELESGLEKAAINTKSAQAAYASRRLERIRDLTAAKLITDQEVDDIKTEKSIANLELRERREQLKLKSITSPIDGVIVERMVAEGDLVTGGEVVRIVSLDPLYVETVMPLERFGTLKKGDAYQVRLQHLETLHQAQVINVDPIIDAASSTFRVRLQMDNPEYRIPSGLKCMLLPADAVAAQ
ncbi:efflux RND transporter periplasmic adaptor subunit [Marinobacterium sediminicola]|uniref:RND family efflux transporter, MFP subunit n=1 Tax=Marinobacterium sediminicola TaxID=518898 RepID=A0ABY1S3A8_9GAMM|nr:efflux RND transporter periplasmic adaptor subunit [Marinobacterium sediminicola]ULG68277.1 efflux RND transporter periplasmic adaptor subunit [Marinobacterium sediminicola]SMR77753.1 RND family efflux transporter, MFP subunit [Marinobacterium sediminicola]